MRKRKNFYIVRYFSKDENCLMAKTTTKPSAEYMMAQGIMPTKVAENEAGGITTWFDLTTRG